MIGQYLDQCKNIFELMKIRSEHIVVEKIFVTDKIKIVYEKSLSGCHQWLRTYNEKFHYYTSDRNYFEIMNISLISKSTYKIKFYIHTYNDEYIDINGSKDLYTFFSNKYNRAKFLLRNDSYLNQKIFKIFFNEKVLNGLTELFLKLI